MAQVFVSWSGDRANSVANALTTWLPHVFQGLSVWMSEHDIEAGERWSHELTGELESSNFGIVCLTPENRKSAWLLFEAGALSKAITKARVVPYRFDLKPADVGPPLAQFQGVDADKQGTLSLVRSVHTAIASPVPISELPVTFAKWWPDLEVSLDKIPRDVSVERRTERDMLEEILDLVRRTGSRELQGTLARILALPNVHSMKVAQKLRAGKPTGTVAFIIRVHEKLPLSRIPEDERIPDLIYGMPTDVLQVTKR